MKYKYTYFFLSFLALAACKDKNANHHALIPPGEAETYYLFFLGGQSNMEGYGKTNELSEEYKEPQTEVLIFQSTPTDDHEEIDGKGIWTQLTPGHGMGFQFDGKKNKLSNSFGPELSFGNRMAELMGEKKIVIIKYVKGGSSIEKNASPYGCWEPDFPDKNGINQYDHFIATMTSAFDYADLNDDGINDKIIPSGIAWMQGEADANHTEYTAQKYESNLARLMNTFRNDLNNKNLPIAIGRIRDSGKDEDGKLMDHCNIVQKAQYDFTQKDSLATLIETTSTCDFLEDGWHYDSECYIKMGNEMAERIFELMENNKSQN